MSVETKPVIAETNEIKKASFEEVKESVKHKYHDLAQKIEESLYVPQAGRFHLEGPTMQSHLKEMYSHLSKFADNDFEAIKELEPNVVEHIKTFFKEKNNVELLKEYIFLHDIAKKDCLEYKFVGEKEKKKELENGKTVESISYIGHAEKGLEILEQSTSNIDSNLKLAVAKHMIVKEFSDKNGVKDSGISGKLYQDRFIDKAEKDQNKIKQQQDLILIGSILDQLGSLGEDMKTDLSPVVNMIKSGENLEKVNQFVAGKNVPENKYANLLKKNGEITTDDLGKLIQQNTGLSGQELGLIVQRFPDLDLPNDKRSEFTKIIKSEGIAGLGKAGFGKAIGKIKQILNESKK